MNRIFKVIWSKTKNCYVVASELAKGRTKAASTGDKAKRLALAAITALMLLPVGGYSYAADTTTVTAKDGTEQTVYTQKGTDSQIEAAKKYTYRKAAELDQKLTDQKTSTALHVTKAGNLIVGTKENQIVQNLKINGQLTSESISTGDITSTGDVTVTGKMAADGVTDETTKDGTYVKQNNTVGNNLVSLDKQVKANDDRITNVKEYLEQQTSDKYVSKADAAVQDGAIVKANKTIGENVTNLDAALASETAARIGADKAQDKVIQQVNQNMVDGFNTINTNMANGFAALNAADAAEKEARIGADKKLAEAVNSGLSLSDDNVLQKNTTTVADDGTVTTSKSDANEMILNKGNKNQITLNEKGIKVGTNSSVMDADGIYTGGDTFDAAKAAMSSDGQIKGANGKFTVDASGNTTVTSLDAGTGTIQTKGDLYAKDATFSGDITAKDVTLSGDLSAKDGTFSGDLSAKDGTFSGDVSAKDVTATGTLQGAEVTDGTATMKNGNITGVKDLSAETITTSGDATIGGDLTVNGKLNVDEIDLTKNGIVGDNNVTASTKVAAGEITGYKKATSTKDGSEKEAAFDYDENGTSTWAKATDADGNWNKSTMAVKGSGVTSKVIDSEKNSNLSTQTSTQSQSTLKDNDSNTNTATQSATKSSSVLQDKEGKTSTFQQRVNEILNQINSSDTVFSKVDQKVDNITSEVTDGTNTTSSAQTTTDITNTAKQGTITNEAQKLVNKASDMISNEAANNITNTSTNGNISNTANSGTISNTAKNIENTASENITNTAKNGSITNDAKNIANIASETLSNSAKNITNATTDNMTNTIGKNLTTTVGGDMSTEVTGNQSNTVKGTLTETVTGKVTEDYKSDLSTKVSGNETHYVAGSQTNTVSGDRTVSVKGTETENFNAQVTNVKTDQKTSVGGNQTNIVAGNQQNTVSGSKTETVKGSVTEKYGSQATTVDGDQSTHVGGSQSNVVTGNQTNTISGSKTETVKGAVSETYGSQTTKVNGDQSTTVTGKQTNSITGDQVNTIGGSQTTTVTGDVTEDYKANLSTTVGGNQTTTVTGDSSLTAENINNTAKNKITNKAIDVETDASSSIVNKVSNDAGSNTSTQLSYQTKEEMSQADGKTASYLRGAAEEKSQLTDGDKKTTIDTVAGQTNTNITDGTNTSNDLQKADQIASSVTDGTNTTVVNQDAKSLASSITDGTKANNTNNTVDKSEQRIKANDTQYSATTKTATKMEDALVSGSNIIDVIKGLDAAGNPLISSVVTNGTTITGISQNAKDINLSAAGGTITNDAQNITNKAAETLSNSAKNIANTTTEDMTNTIGKNLKTTVGGDMSTEVTGSQSTIVKGNQSNTVEGTLTETVTGKATENYNGGLETTITGEEKHTVNGNQTNNITGNQTNTIGGAQTTTVTGDSSLSAKNITNTASEKITNQIGDGSAVKSEMTADGITNTAEGGTIYNKSKDILNEASGDILNFADGEIGNVATKITNITGDNTVTSDTNGTTFENKAHNTAIKEGTVTKTTISGNTIETGQATMDYAEVMKDLGVHGNATVDQKLTVKGDSDLQGNANVGKNLTVNGTSDLKGNVTMESNATVQKDLTVNGTTTTNKLVVNNGATIKGGTTTDTLHVTSSSTFDGAATFKDVVTMEKDLSVGGNATVAGSMTASSYKVGDKTYISESGINANNQKVVNVAAGDLSANSTDAVNGAQLYQTNERVTGVENKVNKLDSRVDKVGANAAALANLHPLEFDADSKWNIAAAVGGYKGETATAIGAFYRPNENVMVNVSSSFGTGENMYGGGISLRIGQGGNKARRNATNGLTEREKAMQKQIDSLTSRLDALLSVINPNMSKDFPDVPENHWAYEAVSRLAGNGVIQGYEDGKYHGDRTMTRYEMAEIIYNALSKGAKAEKKLVEEFKPELQAMAAQKKA
ncbi:ESPR-type extended signal peptide-containing protein [Megasphaera elsdenii]|uniref:ESPR-type extended signal peptide-containing protein n=1 Tax=Megasphaera elsdenii TaxID=907 RepID=UPI00265F6F8C|nr:ESPR-type extended signal peptide-containing protein [Megasphaera elsdenii]